MLSFHVDNIRALREDMGNIFKRMQDLNLKQEAENQVRCDGRGEMEHRMSRKKSFIKYFLIIKDHLVIDAKIDDLSTKFTGIRQFAGFR